MTANRATIAEINLEAFRHNLKIIRTLVGSKTKTMAVVKADGYGHGAVACARAALEAGADWLGVGILQEGVELREMGIQAPILVLSGIFPGEIDELLRNNLSTSLYTSEMIEQLNQQARRRETIAGVHIKVDTGMTRLGIPPGDLLCLIDHVQKCKNLRLDGIFTHFSSADESDPEYTLLQLSRFNRVLDALKKESIAISLVHSANTAALLKFPQSRYDLVRPGIILFGALPAADMKNDVTALLREAGQPDFQPVLQWKTKVLQINPVSKGTPLSYGKSYIPQRESRIATLPVGYADGLARNLSNKMEVIVREHRVPQVGNICMDMCMIDVTDLPQTEVGDEVVLIGRQGDTAITVEDMAEWGNTISYEILCSVGKRVPRIYLS